MQCSGLPHGEGGDSSLLGTRGGRSTRRTFGSTMGLKAGGLFCLAIARGRQTRNSGSFSAASTLCRALSVCHGVGIQVKKANGYEPFSAFAKLSSSAENSRLPNAHSVNVRLYRNTIVRTHACRGTPVSLTRIYQGEMQLKTLEVHHTYNIVKWCK